MNYDQFNLFLLLPDLCSKRVLSSLSLPGMISLSETCQRMYYEFHQIQIEKPSPITQHNPICPKCSVTAIRSRQKYYHFSKLLSSLLTENETSIFSLSFLPMIYQQYHICPCQYKQSFLLQEVVPKLQSTQFVASLSSETKLSLDIHTGSGVIISLSYCDQTNSPINQRMLLWLEDDTIAQESSRPVVRIYRLVLNSRPPIITSYFSAKPLGTYLNLLLRSFSPIDLSQLDQYDQYLTGEYLF